MSGKKRELSKLEQYAKRMEKYNPGERWQEFFGMVVGYIILVIGWVILCLIGFRPFDMVMHITVLGFLFCYECYSGWMITNIYLKVGNISRKERQAISWVVCYMPLEWEEYYRVIWKKILNYVKGMEALWFVLNILTVLIANMESETIQGDSVIEVAWPKTWDQTGYVLISWIAGAVLMIAGLFIGFCLARVFEKRRQKYILENNREKVQWEKTKEVKSDNKQYMKYKVICCVVIIIVHCCFFCTNYREKSATDRRDCIPENILSFMCMHVPDVWGAISVCGLFCCGSRADSKKGKGRLVEAGDALFSCGTSCLYRSDWFRYVLRRTYRGESGFCGNVV